MIQYQQNEGPCFCLVSSDELITSVVRLGCPEPCRIDVFAFEGIVNLELELSESGKELVESAKVADAVLVAWHVEKAPLVNTLAYHVRKALAGPVIALCSGNHYDKVAALAAGADDAVLLPLYLPLLQAIVVSYRRLANASQRSDVSAPRAVVLPEVHTSETDREISHGMLRISDESRRFYIGNQEVPLTPREYVLIKYMMVHAEKACSRDQILNDVWGLSFETGTNMVDVYMYFLRRKLEAHGLKGMIETIRGFGYRLSLSSSVDKKTGPET